jgi:hypothetical protein
VPDVLIPAPRWERWLENFEERHGPATLEVVDGALTGRAEDGSTFTARLPFSTPYAGPVAGFADAAVAPADWGVLLVRKGGFAVARMAGERMVAHKIGQRHVQGRTKAGGQSQQRFARRRANQARQAYEAAADHAARLLGDDRDHRDRGAALPLVVGGDREAVEQVLADRRLGGVAVAGPWLAVADPRRAVLDEAVRDARALPVSVHNA